MNFKLALGLCLLFFSSCVTHQPIQYLEGNFDASALKQVKWQEPVFQTGDLLSIVVHSDNADAAAIYNKGGGMTSATASFSTGITGAKGTGDEGYLIDQEGTITFAGIGKLKVAGLTKKQLINQLEQYFIDKNLLIHPDVDVRFLNFKVTVMGEVMRPGSFSLPAERINIMEALGLAGDFSPFARKDIVTVIRESNGERTFARLDFRDPAVFNSPYYQLQQNDIVMVPANDKKESANDQLTIRYISLGTGIVSVLAILVNIFRK